MTDIDYTQKIRNFQNLTDNYNEEEALFHLEKSDWNEKVAADNYKRTKNKKNESSFNQKDEAKDVLLDNHYNESQVRASNTQERRLQQTNSSNQGYLSRLYNFISYIFCSKFIFNCYKR